MEEDLIYQLLNDTFDAGEAHQYRVLLLDYPQLYGENRKSVLDFRLRHAADRDHVELIDVLVEFGADVNAPESSSSPEGAIIQCCLGGNCKIAAAQRLLELGAKINFEIDGAIRCQPLDLAISKGNLEMVKLLVEYGAAYNSIYRGMTAIDHALSRGQLEIAEYLRSIGGKTAEDLGWTPPPPPPEPELSQVLARYFAEEYMHESLGTIQGMLDSDPIINIHVFDEGVQYVLHTEGMASRPIPTDSGDEQYRFVEIEMILPQDWPMGDDLLKADASAWPVQWLRRLALHPHHSEEPIGKLFFYPNGSPPQPFASNTQMCYWMLMLSRHDPIYVSEEKQIAIYSAVPLYKEEYDLIQRCGLGELGKRFDENKIYPHQMFVRKNVGL